MDTGKMTQKDLASRLDVTPIHLNAVLRGRKKASAKLAVRIEEEAGIPKERLRPDIFGQPKAESSARLAAGTHPEEAA